MCIEQSSFWASRDRQLDTQEYHSAGTRCTVVAHMTRIHILKSTGTRGPMRFKKWHLEYCLIVRIVFTPEAFCNWDVHWIAEFPGQVPGAAVVTLRLVPVHTDDGLAHQDVRLRTNHPGWVPPGRVQTPAQYPHRAGFKPAPSPSGVQTTRVSGSAGRLPEFYRKAGWLRPTSHPVIFSSKIWRNLIFIEKKWKFTWLYFVNNHTEMCALLASETFGKENLQPKLKRNQSCLTPIGEVFTW